MDRLLETRLGAKTCLVLSVVGLALMCFMAWGVFHGELLLGVVGTLVFLSVSALLAAAGIRKLRQERRGA